ncbi:MAG TPA: universal stress protein [Flavobacteriales bacterium]|nr:universal stress protein [Flavobacteriales bacterium]
MKTFLVPTDFSDIATNSMNYALEWARHENAKVVLLHIFNEIFVMPGVLEEVTAQQIIANQDAARARLQEIYTEILEEKKVACEQLALFGTPVDTILEVAEEKQVDLIIMGTHGANGFLERLLGSTTTKVIEQAQCPVMAIPENARFKEIKKFTYATDYHAHDIEALKAVANFAKSFNARLNLIHIHVGDFASSQMMLKEFTEKTVAATGYANIGFQLISGRDVEKELEAYMDAGETDLMVMSTHQRNIFDKLFGKSITKRVTFHTHIPLLVFHHKQTPIIF